MKNRRLLLFLSVISLLLIAAVLVACGGTDDHYHYGRTRDYRRTRDDRFGPTTTSTAGNDYDAGRRRRSQQGIEWHGDHQCHRGELQSLRQRPQLADGEGHL